MSEEPKATNDVGYKKPPKTHRFAPGRSGNPSGKPKGTRSFKSDLREELSELVPFREGGRDIELSKQRLLIKRLVASALDGEARAIATLVGICVRTFADEGDSEDTDNVIDREIAETFNQRRKNKATSNNLKQE